MKFLIKYIYIKKKVKHLFSFLQCPLDVNIQDYTDCGNRLVCLSLNYVLNFLNKVCRVIFMVRLYKKVCIDILNLLWITNVKIQIMREAFALSFFINRISKELSLRIFYNSIAGCFLFSL